MRVYRYWWGWALLILTLVAVGVFDYYSADWGRGELQARGSETIVWGIEEHLVLVK